MENGSPALEVGLDIVTGGSFGEIDQLKRAFGEAEGQIVRQATTIEGAVGGMVNTKPAIAEFKAFAASASQSTSAIEKSAERMAFALKREIDTFGMSKTEMRDWRLEQKAMAAESVGLTEVAGRLRAVGAEMQRLEAEAANAAGGVRKTGGAMAAMAPQAQDLFTQISMGGNVINAFVIQAGQMSSQLVYMEGAAGKVGAFMMGPWGLALTAGALVVGALSDKLFGNAEASKKAEDGMKRFQDRQSDIGSFIDMTTGRLTEQNRILILNATLTRQKGIADNEASIRDARKDAFRIAGNTQMANAPMVATGTSGIVTTQRMTDPAVQAAIRAANGDVGKLVDSINRLSKTRPDLGPLALQLTSVAGGAITASRENENLRKELRGLAGDATAYGKASATAIERQVALATARTPLARARAQLDLVKAGADAAEKQGGAALKAYEADLTRTTRAVQAAEAAERSAAQGASRARTAASAARREALKEVRDQIKGEEDLRKWVAKGFDSPQFTVIGNVEAAKRAAEQMRTVFKAEFGDGDLLGDQIGSYNDGQAAKWDKASDALQEYNDALGWTVERLDLIAQNTADAGRGMADAFGAAGRALGNLAAIYTGFEAHRARLDADRQRRILDANGNERNIARANERFALQSASAQIGAFGDMASAAKGFFNEKSKGYAIITGAEKAFRAVEFALSVRAIAQDAVETGSSIAKSVARTAVSATEAVVNAIKSLPFPLNLAAGAATAGAIAALGVSIAGGFGGGGNKLPAANTSTGTVLGDRDAKSESVKRAIDGLRDIDTLMLSSSREMAATLRSIDGQIGGVAALVVRAGDVNASAGVTEGFKTNAIGSVLKAVVPIFGGALASLFGSKTTVVGSGLYGGAQTLGSVLNGGFDASYYSDVEKKKKFFGITTGTSYSTQYTGADAGLENQFTLILRNFNSAIVQAAGPLGEATDAIQSRLNGFVVNLGKIDFKGLTGAEIQEKLTAVFGAAADNMAASAFPGFERFQKVGEGLFETLVRVSSTVEAVSASLDLLGTASQKMGIDAKVGLADRFDSVSALTSAADAYFQAFYTKEEQATAKTARFARVFDSLGMAMPVTLDGFRKLVEAQDLTTAAGQSTYATLLQLAPAFAELKSAMDGAKSAADILVERQDLQRKLLELNGDTAAIRALDLAKVDVSNRALQEQVWAIEDAQKAAQAAEQLASAWSSVGDSINDEIKRIRGLDASGGNSFAVLQGQFNAATTAARGGDMDAAKLLPSLSQALLKTAGDVATSRQELDRVQSQTAASLEATSAVIAALAKGNPLTSGGTVAAAAMAAQAAVPTTATTSSGNSDVQRLIDEVSALRRDNNAGHAATAGNTGRLARTMDDVTAASGGDAISVASAA